MAANVLLKGNQTLYCGVSSLHFLTPGGLYPHFCHSLSTFWPPCILAGPHTHHDPASFRGITCNCPFRLQSFYPGVLKFQVALPWSSLPGLLLPRPPLHSTASTFPLHIASENLSHPNTNHIFSLIFMSKIFLFPPYPQ